MRQLTGSILVVVAAIGFGFMVLFGKAWTLDRGVSVEMMLFLRFVIAGAIMAGIMVARGLKWPRGGTLVGLIMMGAILYVAEAMFFFQATLHIPGPLVSLLLYIYPVIVTIFAWLFLKEKLKSPQLVALGLAIIGLVMTIVPELREQRRPLTPRADAALGVLLGIGCAVSYSIYILVGGRFSRRGGGAIPASTIVILSTAAVFGAMTLGRGDPLPNVPIAWAGVLGLALISTVISITALLAGLERIGPVQTSTLSTLEPVTTALVGATLMNDTLSAVQLSGGACILAAAVIIARAGAASAAAVQHDEPPVH